MCYDTYMNNYNHSVKTGLFGKLNKTILDSVMGQLSDGKWENSPGMNKYWRNANVKMDASDAVIIEVNTEAYGSGFRGRDDAWILRKFAGWLKNVAQTELEDGAGGYSAEWSRSDQTNLCYLNHGDVKVVTIADAYRAYDTLKGRNAAKLAKTAEGKALRQAAIALVDDEIRRIENQLATMKAKRAAL
jgi:hypothetical protein